MSFLLLHHVLLLKKLQFPRGLREEDREKKKSGILVLNSNKRSLGVIYQNLSEIRYMPFIQLTEHKGIKLSNKAKKNLKIIYAFKRTFQNGKIFGASRLSILCNRFLVLPQGTIVQLSRGNLLYLNQLSLCQEQGQK